MKYSRMLPFNGLLALMLSLAVPAGLAGPAEAQVFTRLTAASDPANPIVLAPGADANAYSGASWIDYDRDGWPDLFVNRRGLYRNLGGGQFERLATGPSDDGPTRGNSWADIDGDGDMDVFLSGGSGDIDRNDKGSFLFRNDAGVFVKDFRGTMVDSLGNSGWGCAFADYDLDGDPDLVIASAYLFTGYTLNRLLRNNGDGSLERDTGTDVTATLDSYTIPTWSDFDQDGDPDLSIGAGPANGGVDVDSFFLNQTRESGTPRLLRLPQAPPADRARDGQVWNWIDFDNDGDLDVYITNYGAVSPLANELYRNEGGVFVSMTAAQAGPIVSDRARSLASVWGDFDNDGDLDCLVTNDATATNRYYANDGAGGFTALDLGTLTTDAGPHYGACAGDHDRDGDLDLFVNGTGARAGLFRNDTAPGAHWAEFSLRGTTSNRAAIGARVRVLATIGGAPRWQLREVSAQNSFNGQNDLVAHFGLGDAAVIDSLSIEWPSGLHEMADGLAPDGWREIVEGSLAATPLALAFEPVSQAFVDGRVHLAWQATRPVSGLVELERSVTAADPGGDDSPWSRVEARAGSTTGLVAFEDDDVKPGRRQGYRLAWSENARRRFGEPVWLDIPFPGLAVAVGGQQPLRAGGTGWFQLDFPRAGTAELVVVDVAGRALERIERTTGSARVERVDLDPARRLPNGAYFVRVTFEGETRQARFVILR